MDQDEQVNGYDALIRAFSGRADEVSEIYIWHWGMPGAHESYWFTHPNGQDNEPGSTFDESLGNAAVKFIADRARAALESGFR